MAVPVAPQVFDLLLTLVRKPGAVLTRDDLIEAVWGGGIVSDSAISARVSAAWREWTRRIEAVLFASASPVAREDLGRVVGRCVCRSADRRPRR